MLALRRAWTEFSFMMEPLPPWTKARPLRYGCFLLLVLSNGCALAGGAGPVSSTPDGTGDGWSEVGIASWYGQPFHGRTTASGEVYDMNAPTGAHRTLPFGTRLRVENLDNGRSTTLTINDRGPFVDGRILDVSRSVAEELGMLGPGTARVRITFVGRELPYELSRAPAGRP